MSLVLDWADNADNEDNYVVERSPNGTSAWVALTSTLPADTETYEDATPLTGETWFYRVKCTNLAGDSGYTSVVSGTEP